MKAGLKQLVSDSGWSDHQDSFILNCESCKATLIDLRETGPLELGGMFGLLQNAGYIPAVPIDAGLSPNKMTFIDAFY